MIDNFDIVRNRILQFVEVGEFYLILILRRRKDIKGDVPEGVNEDNRLIKHFFVYDKEYFDRKRQAIINLCEQNNARAYILPQRRTHNLVMWELHNKTGEILKSGAKNTHFDHLIRSCVAGMHEVPPDAKWHKRWVIDIDEDEMLPHVLNWGSITGNTAWKEGKEVKYYVDFLSRKIGEALMVYIGSRPGPVCEFMPKVEQLYNFSPVTVLPTPHGWHIVTPPFNRDPKAMEKYFGTPIQTQCIKPDAMAMLYAPDTI